MTELRRLQVGEVLPIKGELYGVHYAGECEVLRVSPKRGYATVQVTITGITDRDGQALQRGTHGEVGAMLRVRLVPMEWAHNSSDDYGISWSISADELEALDNGKDHA